MLFADDVQVPGNHGTAVLNGTFYQPADTLDQVSLVLTMVSEYWLNEQEQRVRE